VPPKKRRPRGHIEQLASGSWRVHVYAGVDPLTGRERRLRATVRDQKSAEAALTKLLGEVDEDRHPKSNITVKQAVDHWFDVADLADTTRERYQDLIRLYINPVLSALRLEAVPPDDTAEANVELFRRLPVRPSRCNAKWAVAPGEHG
jgi:hypothetical protein